MKLAVYRGGVRVDVRSTPEALLGAAGALALLALLVAALEA